MRSPLRALLRLWCCSSAVSAAFFPNPFADLLRQTPISVEKRNFAQPRHPELVTVNEALPVYEVPGFLSDAECDELMAAAQSGQFPPIPYGAKNKIFTGTKYAAHKQDASVDAFLERACECFGCGAERFDPVTVTRYAAGEYQARHLDARLPHQINRDAAYMRTGGQRIAQLIVYLRAPEAGGGTKFYDGAFGGLTVAHLLESQQRTYILMLFYLDAERERLARANAATDAEMELLKRHFSSLSVPASLTSARIGIQSLQFQHVLGHGSFGEVRSALWRGPRARSSYSLGFDD